MKAFSQSFFSNYPSKRFGIFAACFSVLFQMAICSTALAQETDNAAGTETYWLGELDVTVMKLRLAVTVSIAEDGTPTAKMVSLDQDEAEIPVDSFVMDGDQVQMEMKKVQASFNGTLNEDHSACEGTFTQFGKEYTLVFEKVTGFPSLTHVESWRGTMLAAEQEFKFRLRVFEDEEKNRTAKLDSISESINGLPTEFSQDGSQFSFDVPVSGASYTGELSEDGKSVTGTWSQRGGKYELNFEAVAIDEKIEEPNRPQTPQEPFPYETVELKFRNEVADVELAGTLTLPKAEPLFTAILISGSGPQDRNEELLGHQPFAVLADHLTRAGIAVFRFDDRGVGESSGNFAEATSEDFATDVEAIVAGLRTDERLKSSKIGLIGHSEGGLIAPMVAVKNDDVEFIVLMAGPGVTGQEILLRQSRDIAMASGASEEAIEINEAVMKALLPQLTPENVEDGILESTLEKLKASVSEEEKELFELSDAAKAQFAQMETPWFRFFNVYDPAPTLEKVKCPVLSVIGEKDLQVACELNQTAIEAALQRGGNEDFTISNLPNLNHLFQECETGSPSEYAKIEETLNPAFLNLVSKWILELAENH